MGKKSSNQAKSVNVVSENVRKVTEVIGSLCEAKGLVPTDKYAVLKELVKAGSKSADKAYTRWAKMPQVSVVWWSSTLLSVLSRLMPTIRSVLFLLVPSNN